MEFCKLVYSHNDDTEAEKQPNLTEEYCSCRCESEDELSNINECCNCSYEQEEKTNIGYTCVCETSNECLKSDKSTTTCKYNNSNCNCNENEFPQKTQKDDKVTITDGAHGFDCVCFSTDNKSNKIIVKDLHPTQSARSSRLNLSNPSELLEPRGCKCFCFYEIQNPVNESTFLRDEELLPEPHEDASKLPVNAADSNHVSEITQTSIDTKYVSDPTQTTSVDTQSRYTNLNRDRRVCFCPDLVQPENALINNERTVKSSKSQLKKEYLVNNQPARTSTISTTQTPRNKSAAKISSSEIKPIIPEIFSTLSNKGSRPMVSVKSDTFQSNPKSANDVTKFNSGQVATRSSQTSKMLVNVHVADSGDHLNKRISTQSSRQQTSTTYTEPLSEKYSTMDAVESVSRKPSRIQQKEQVTNSICQCCQMIGKSPSAPCVRRNKFTPVESKSMKSQSTCTDIVKPERKSKSLQTKKTSEFQKAAWETNNSSHKNVITEESEDEEEKELDEKELEENEYEEEEEKRKEKEIEKEKEITRGRDKEKAKRKDKEKVKVKDKDRERARERETETERDIERGRDKAKEKVKERRKEEIEEEYKTKRLGNLQENENQKFKQGNHAEFCDLQELLSRKKGKNMISKPSKIQPPRELTVTKEDLDIIEEYFRDREDDDEEFIKPRNKGRGGYFNYHFLMTDTPTTTVEVKQTRSGKLKDTQLKLDWKDGTKDSPSKEYNTETAKRNSKQQPTAEKIMEELSTTFVNEKMNLEAEIKKKTPKETRNSTQSENLSLLSVRRPSRKYSENPDAIFKQDLPEDEKEVHLTDATWAGQNQGLTSNLDTYGSLEKMVVEKVEDPYERTNTKEPVSVFEEILKEEKRKFTRTSMASQRSMQSRMRDHRGSSKFFDFFRGWISQKPDLKKKIIDEKRRKKSITIRESDDELISKTPSESSLNDYHDGANTQRTSLNAYRSRALSDVAPRPDRGVYSGNN